MIRICPDRDATCPNGMDCQKPCATGRYDPPNSPKAAIDPDEAPEWSDEVFDRAEIRQGDKVIRPASGTLTKDATDGPLCSASKIRNLQSKLLETQLKTLAVVLAIVLIGVLALAFIQLGAPS